MYHPQNQRIPGRSTYPDSGAHDEQNEHLHRTFSSTKTSVAAKDPILPCKFPLNWENPNMGWIRERPTWLDSGAQDEQNEHQHQCSLIVSVLWYECSLLTRLWRKHSRDTPHSLRKYQDALWFVSPIPIPPLPFPPFPPSPRTLSFPPLHPARH